MYVTYSYTWHFLCACLIRVRSACGTQIATMCNILDPNSVARESENIEYKIQIAAGRPARSPMVQLWM